MDKYIQLPLPDFDNSDPRGVSGQSKNDEPDIDQPELAPNNEIQPLLIGFQELLLETEFVPDF